MTNEKLCDVCGEYVPENCYDEYEGACLDCSMASLDDLDEIGFKIDDNFDGEY